MASFQKTRVVCFGGGTGLPSLLSGLKANPWLEITAIVSMFDSGGSSGKLRDRFGILPPGDILRCLLALSDDEAAARTILLKRVHGLGNPEHNAGNVLLMGLERVYPGYFEAIDALGQILSVKGRVIPVTTDKSNLCAAYADGSENRGEVEVDKGISQGQEVRRLFLDPQVRASHQALKAIDEADLICAGPGSFYTSVLPNFLPINIKAAIAGSRAPLVFVANLVTEGLGMSYSVEKYLDEFAQYAGRSADLVIVNSHLPSGDILTRYGAHNKVPVTVDAEQIGHVEVVAAELWLDSIIARHDAARLAGIIWDIIGQMRSL